MKESLHYIKVVEWSPEDNCFVGSCPRFHGERLFTLRQDGAQPGCIGWRPAGEPQDN